jgi:hypothetical protein
MTLRKRQTLEIERGSTRSFFVKNWHCKSRWICRKEDCGMIQLYKLILSLCGLKWIRHLMAEPDCISPHTTLPSSETSNQLHSCPLSPSPSSGPHCMLLPVAIFALPSLSPDRSLLQTDLSHTNLLGFCTLDIYKYTHHSTTTSF